MVSIPHNAQTSSLEESDKLEATKELIEVEWRKMKEADDSVLSRQESLQSEEKWSSTRTSAWRTRHPACWAGGRTTRKSCQSCPRWWRRFWRCQPRQQRARECLVLVQTSSPHDCLPPALLLLIIIIVITIMIRWQFRHKEESLACTKESWGAFLGQKWCCCTVERSLLSATSAATQPSKMIIWKCTRWFTVEWSPLLANSASTPVNS